MPRCICRKRWQEEVQAEALVAQHLRAFCQFWHTRSGLEVDFIVYGPKSVSGHRGEKQLQLLP
jgi:hypothetical protein